MWNDAGLFVSQLFLSIFSIPEGENEFLYRQVLSVGGKFIPPIKLHIAFIIDIL